MLIDDIITGGLFALASGVAYNEADERANALQRLYLESAQGMVSDYLGYDVDNLKAGDTVAGQLMDVKIDGAAMAKIKNAILRIATLLQQEQGGNIGVSKGGEGFDGGRVFLNVVNYKPYLHPLSTLRLIGGLAAGKEAEGDKERE